ncbi:MAG: hypothetical protein IJJ26_07465 [Victivallales bacterium]|nr:hypothetical protein [Victivallales bacterium]
MNMAEQSDIWIFSKPGTPIASLLARLPHARSLTTKPQAELPRLAIVQIETEQDCDLVWDFVKSKTPVALAFPKPQLWMVEKLRGLSRRAQHNRVPVVVLGSWRYYPAVAALKEIASTCVLGEELELRAGLHESVLQPLFARERLADLGAWLANGHMSLSSAGDSSSFALELTGPNGSVRTEVPWDGSATACEIEVRGHRHSRIVPSANPAVSELAVLGLSLDGIPGKIKALPALMPFWA